MIQLICQDLSLGYAGRVVCEGIDFSLSQGDYLCITGENGTGKKHPDQNAAGSAALPCGDGCA